MSTASPEAKAVTAASKVSGITPERYVGFFAGLASGATKLLVGHPFDTIKVRMQTEGGHGRFNGPLHCLRTTIRKEGARALYKGATPPLLGWALMDSVQMGSLNNFRLLIQGGNPAAKLTIPEHALAGLGAGIVVSFVATPVEVLKGRLQVQYDAATRVYSGPVDCAAKLIKNNGIGGLYKGLTACILFRSFFWVLWGSYEIYNRAFTSWGMSPSLLPFFAGGCAANTFWTISFPML
ncbi:mitochondrial carrier domain-containing protein [Gaertneriomyces semiglobifer]|nr:mitochondrial carrier domain-containing protein [Gaertneriomyces semiglobifer]